MVKGSCVGCNPATVESCSSSLGAERGIRSRLGLAPLFSSQSLHPSGELISNQRVHGARRPPLSRRREEPLLPIRPVRRPIDAGGVSPSMPLTRPRSTREEAADVHCGSGFWGGQRPSLADYVTMRGPSDWAPAAEGARVAYAPCSSTVARHPRYRIFRIMSLGLAFSVTVHGGR